MAIASKDIANSEGEKLETRTVTIELEGNEGLSGNYPLQTNSFASDPFISFSNNEDDFVSAASPLTMKVVDNPSASVSFKASSKANVSIPRDTNETVGVDGIVSQYLFTSLDSYMKIFLTIPDDSSVYTVRCQMDETPSATNHILEVHVSEELNITVNTFNITVRYDNSTDAMSLFVKGRAVGLGLLYVHTTRDQVVGTRRRRSTGSGYSSGAAVYSPRVWNETAKAWVPSSDLEVDPDSSEEKVVFKSNFMGSMTSGLTVPPNTIEFDEVFTDLGAKTKENPYVLIVVSLIAGIYLLLLIPVRRLDIRDYKKWEFLPILQNEPEDRFIYQITISVGKQSSKLFDTEVYCCLYGGKGKTTPKTLVDGKRKNFQPASLTNLTVTCQEDLGDITHIHLWTKARDERDSLYVEWITVADPELQKSYSFLCNDWISPVQTLCYGHEIFRTDIEEGKDFTTLFKDNAKSKIFDDHLWLSVIKRPNKSKFSRVQRLSMCLSTLFLTMVVNAMWFPTTPEAKQDTGASVQLGPISLSWRTFYVAFMGSLIVIPPNMLIMIFFRRSRQFVPPGQRRKVKQERGSVKAIQLDSKENMPPNATTSTSVGTEVDVPDNRGGSGEVKDLSTIPAPKEPVTSTEGNVAGTSSEGQKKEVNLSVGNLKLLNGTPERKTKGMAPPTTLTALEKEMSAHKLEQELKALEKKNNKPFMFPWWGVILGYILCGVCIANGVWWPYLYSIQWGKDLSLEWLATLTLSVFQSIIVIQPVKVILLAVVAALLLQETFGEPEEDTSLIITVSDLKDRVKTPSSKEPPIKPQNIARADPVVAYTEAKLYGKLTTKAKATFTHLLYLGLLIAIVSHNTDTDYYYQNKAVKGILELDDIGLSRVEDIYPWLEETIFPSIYPITYYNGEFLSESDQRFFSNIYALLMGPVRMKQNRDQEVECDELKKAESSRMMKIYDCKAKEETRDWNAKWNGTYEAGVTYPPYIHEVIKGQNYHGQLKNYKLGGYTITMRNYNWQPILNLLNTENWIDKQTRAVFIEFVINNQNVNIFTQVKIILEMPVYGGVFASYQVNSFRPYPYVDTWDFVFLVIQCIWFLVLCYIVFKEVKDFVKDGLLAYVSDAWHWTEVFNTIFALLSIVFYALRTVEVIKAVEFMKNNKDEYVDFDTVKKWDMLYSMFIAAVLFIAIMQLYRPMDFSRQLNSIKTALSHSGNIIAWYVLIFILLLFLYSHTMTIAFGDRFGSFVNFFGSFYYLFGMLLGILKYTDLIEEDINILRLMFAVFMIFGNFILLNMFISVISEGLAYMNEHPEAARFDEELAEFMSKKLTKWWASLAGGSSVKKSKKMAKVRRGGPWNRELELYYSLLEEKDVTPIDETEALQHQTNVDKRADETIEAFEQVSFNKLTESERKKMKKCTSHGRNEHTVRAAIKTIIWDMILSNEKFSSFMNKRKTPRQKDEAYVDEYHCLNETDGRIGPEGGRLEVLPGTWIIIDKGTFAAPTFVRVQAYTTELFASHVIQLESEQPLAKPFKCCLPFKDGKRRDYCNVFVQRDDGPWTLSYNSVTCFSEKLRCMCHPKGSETKYRIAAKATPRKTVAKAGHTLHAKIAEAAVIDAVVGNNAESEGVSRAITEHLVGEMAQQWKNVTEENERMKNKVQEEIDKADDEYANSRYNLDLL